MAAALRNSLLAFLFFGAAAGRQEVYSQNALCRKMYCVNPLFPGLNDLHLLEQLVWQCTKNTLVSPYIGFCKGVVNYDPALPSPNSTATVEALVQSQDDAAATMYFYHLSGMGYEAWDHQEPSKDVDPCVQSVWRMACYTYFPKAQAGCGPGLSSPYQRPCSGPCQSYLQACQVECCDESAVCVFEHQTHLTNGSSILQTGYVAAAGPSSTCTGSGSHRLEAPLALLLGLLGLHCAAGALGGAPAAAAAPAPPPAAAAAGRSSPRAARPSRGWAQAVLAGGIICCSVMLQGCEMEVPHHNLGNWRAEPNYLEKFQCLPDGKDASQAILNSCADPSLPVTAQCSGRGYCKEFNAKSTKTGIAFCVCDAGWTDPECKTRRKSQLVTFFCSLFGGFVGADYFYLGFYMWGGLKLITLGGFGAWWLIDIVRTGAGPIYAYDFRVASDLPHWAFVLGTASLFGIIGLIYSLDSYMYYRRQKRDDVMKMRENEEARHISNMEQVDGPRYRATGPPGYSGRHGFTGYGAALPATVPNAAAPYGAPQPGPPAPQALGRQAGPYGPVAPFS